MAVLSVKVKIIITVCILMLAILGAIAYGVYRYMKKKKKNLNKDEEELEEVEVFLPATDSTPEQHVHVLYDTKKMEIKWPETRLEKIKKWLTS
ncbi:uncharacterized protein LOC130290956 isoform X2 [Hyla sarda]|uniref:uncharacterized protein LOC130290956 isoform X2 n=1 Tax=Hyla sarda TaxID=327740 RepID=UPI0024C230CC|nr:uncharacterized protein LOC130290956 isoform X2 [Hyla sarda]